MTGGEETGAKLSQSLKAVLALREMISRGDVRPGERMSELALVDRLGLSRTPIRAALARLALEGLLEEIPSGGYAVRAFSDEDVADAIELRGVIEGMAARLAAERGASPARIADLREVVGALDRVLEADGDGFDFEAYVDLNGRFHEGVAGLAGSDVVRREAARVAALPFASPNAFLEAQAMLPAFREVLATGQVHHRAILEAIDLREGARAEALSREHARLARRNFAIVMADQRLKTRVPGLALVTN